MAECDQVVQTLKKQLKARGVNYQDVASALSLSEGSVKRLFANGGSLSLERLSAVCQLIDMDMGELFKLSSESTHQITELTWQQEEELVADKALLLVAVCITNGYRFDQILEQYSLPETVLIQKLAHLDRLNVIELQPDNRIKLKISPSFSWVAGGPIQQFFQQQVISAFFQSRFAGDEEKLVMSTGLMSLSTNYKFQQRIQRLVSEFYDSCNQDTDLTMQERHGTSMVVAMRRWTFPLFEEYE
ncbi:transcriptional regulator [Enterovibrio norvegicus]|uniref:Cro/C1-type HTH DNA-binding domain-containing protein n=2 Tax=Enterovibrio norvegicus TaxID=188144 RepID=A0A1I5S3J1_9GAMM|nr:helix-turn-helix transcriptional regulator [Enterovibrio norvegicus]MCC4800857.1 helix-turn-helix transcriptional regulator [Enterovibrio norvegicus]OEE65307.1 transcriptional regulator [Enterovibrio norvegicus]OEF54327.1 transcriptional regulator [Enterovibrio norvegicus]OEF58556.1 transcriptional regulator [Enterovibrio norvegicus]PMH72011.1 transcriptional regulator [Enterovibrio norvegicus]